MWIGHHLQDHLAKLGCMSKRRVNFFETPLYFGDMLESIIQLWQFQPPNMATLAHFF
jgi:hypothetical protein